jgi:uncharacterized membrane protein HdeD (DUF308 family)
LINSLSRRWWVFVVRGILAILFGVAAWAWPGLTLTTLVWFAGFWLVFDGIVGIVSTFLNRDRFERIWPLILLFIAGIGFGIFIMAYPNISVVWLIVTIGLYAIISGVFGIVQAIQLRKEIDNEWWLVGFGVISILFGLAMVVFPGAGALSLIWVIATYAIMIGIAEIFFGFRIRNAGSAS